MNWYMDEDRWFLLAAVVLIVGSFAALAWVTF